MNMERRKRIGAMRARIELLRDDLQVLGAELAREGQPTVENVDEAAHKLEAAQEELAAAWSAAGR